MGLWALSQPILAQTVVRFDRARSHEVGQTIRLDGSVESTRVAVVASEVAGVVADLLTPEGTKVKRGQALLRLRPEPLKLRLRAAMGELAEAEARLKSAELRLGRVQELVASEVVSQQNADDASFEAEAQRGRVEQLRAEVARLEHELKSTTVRAAFHGVVGEEHVQPGEWLNVGDPVVELISLESLEIRLEAPEQYFGGLRTGGEVAISFDALPGVDFRGKVRAVVPRANPRSRTFPVLVQLDNRSQRVGVGMLAHVDLELGQRSDSVLVPKDAVVHREGKDLLYVLEDQKIEGEEATVAKAVDVTTGTGVASWVVVHGDVQAGDRVVTRGNERLADGQQVQGEPLEDSATP